MRGKEDFLESNTARLIRAGCPRDARPDPRARERTYNLMKIELNEKADPSAFPGKALGLLAAVGGVLIVWTLLRVGGMGVRVLEDGKWLALALPLCVNLALAPVASLVIIIQRKKHDKA